MASGVIGVTILCRAFSVRSIPSSKGVADLLPNFPECKPTIRAAEKMSPWLQIAGSRMEDKGGNAGMLVINTRSSRAPVQGFVVGSFFTMYPRKNGGKRRSSSWSPK